MSTDENLEAIEEGRLAALAEGVIGKVVDEQMRVGVTQLIAMYRQGSIDHDMLVGKVAEIAALDQLMSTLENKQVRGSMAADREFGNGKA